MNINQPTDPRPVRLGMAHRECYHGPQDMPSTRVQAPRMKRKQCIVCGEPMNRPASQED